MAGVIVQLPAKTWTALTGKSGSVYHKTGGKVVYVEAASIPTTFDANTPIVFDSQLGKDPQPFSGVAEADTLYAYAIDTAAVISVSARGA